MSADAAQPPASEGGDADAAATDPTAEEGEGEGGGAKLTLDAKGNPFSKHPQSWSLFSSITEGRFRGKIMAMEQELLDYAESHQTLLRSRLTYEELLEGMLYPGETRIPIKPMLIGNMLNCDHEFNVLNERVGVRMFLTNRRIFFLDADLDRVPQLQEAKGDMGTFVLSKLKVSYEVTDDIWYGPLLRAAARTLFHRPHFLLIFSPFFPFFSPSAPGFRNGRKRPRKKWPPPTYS